MVLNEVCSLAGVEGHTPHNARHAMGRHLIDKDRQYFSGSKAVRSHQRGLLHSVRQVTDQELAEALDDR